MRFLLIIFILIIFSSIADDDFKSFEEKSIEMKCLADNGKVSFWRYENDKLFMDLMSFEIDGQMVQKKNNQNVFLIKLPDQMMEFYINFENKQLVSKILGMKIKINCT